MQERKNDLYSIVVNESLAIAKLKGVKEAEDLLIEAGIPKDIVERVLHSTARRRNSDWK